MPGTTTGMTRRNPTQSGATLQWKFNQTVPAHGKVRLHVVVRTPQRAGRYRSIATARIQTAAATDLASRSPASLLRVKREIRALSLRFAGSAVNGKTLRGAAASRFGRGLRALPVGAPARGTLVMTGRGTRLVLRATNLRLGQFGAPTRARVALRVVAARGLRQLLDRCGRHAPPRGFGCSPCGRPQQRLDGPEAAPGLWRGTATRRRRSRSLRVEPAATRLDGRAWDRTRDLPRVKRALSR